MEDEPAAAKRTRTLKPHVPHEVVMEILLRLPTRSLLRFTCVCNAWRATIMDDPVFLRDLHLHRREKPCLPIAPHTRLPNHNRKTILHSHVFAVTGLYRWQETHGAATLMHPMDSLPAEAAHRFAHCHELVPVATESSVRVLNRATRRVLMLPGSRGGALSTWVSHQAFGLGRDPRTNAYKVARFWQRTEPNFSSSTGDLYTPRVEVFTIGAGPYWRELEEPPHLIMDGRQTATFFNGCLLWIIHPCEHKTVSGILCLKLGDETFSVVSRPPCVMWFHNEVSMSDLRGELCVTCPGQNDEMLDMWMCDDVDGADQTQWHKRYTIHWDWARGSLHPVAILGDGVLMCQTSRNMLCSCNLHTHKSVEVKNTFRLNDLEYLNQEEGTLLDYPIKIKFSFDVVPYVPSLTRI